MLNIFGYGFQNEYLSFNLFIIMFSTFTCSLQTIYCTVLILFIILNKVTIIYEI